MQPEGEQATIEQTRAPLPPPFTLPAHVRPHPQTAQNTALISASFSVANPAADYNPANPANRPARNAEDDDLIFISSRTLTPQEQAANARTSFLAATRHNQLLATKQQLRTDRRAPKKRMKAVHAKTGKLRVEMQREREQYGIELGRREIQVRQERVERELEVLRGKVEEWNGRRGQGGENMEVDDIGVERDGQRAVEEAGAQGWRLPGSERQV